MDFEPLVLDISHNEIYGTVPSFSISITKAESIFLNHNQLEGDFSMDFGMPPMALKYFSISHNNLGGPVPIELGFMPNVTHADVSNCYWEGPLPEFFQLVSKMEYAIFSNNLFRGTLPNSLGKKT